MYLSGGPVKSSDSMGPQPVEQVGVVAVAEERLRVSADDLRIQMWHNGDLVVAFSTGVVGYCLYG
jgi:hypothetical protein